MINNNSAEPLDHRQIGREMGIFTQDKLSGSGLPLWLPAGAIIRRELEQYAHRIAIRTGCQEVYSPVLAKRELYERSGHWAKFADDMFPPMDLGGDASDHLVLRPANCPHHALLYAAEQHSHRDLPIRYHELAPMFRAERSGVLSGMTRVRQINLDDTHVFCRPDQLGAEVALALDAIIDAFSVLGIEISYLRLSRRGDGDGYLGGDDQWRDAEDQLRQVLERARHDHPELSVQEAPGEAAFYGPKIDIQVLDARGHEESLSTVQVDFNQPVRLGLNYVAADGSRQPVIMIHRGLIGAMERMVAFLLEIHNGRLPLWLAPVQLALLPVGPAHHDHVQRVADRIGEVAGERGLDGIRVRIDADDSLGRRIRSCRIRRDALIGVIGDAEIAAGQVDLQNPGSGVRQNIEVDKLAAALVDAVVHRSPALEGF